MNCLLVSLLIVIVVCDVSGWFGGSMVMVVLCMMILLWIDGLFWNSWKKYMLSCFFFSVLICVVGVILCSD